MKIAVYCRVSTDKEEQKSSLNIKRSILSHYILMMKLQFFMMKDKQVLTLEGERDFKKC